MGTQENKAPVYAASDQGVCGDDMSLNGVHAVAT